MIAACLRCGASDDLWTLPAREAGAGKPCAVARGHAVDEGRGWYEYVICGACEHTVFYAREIDAERRTVDEFCPDCRSTSRTTIERLLEWTAVGELAPALVRLGKGGFHRTHHYWINVPGYADDWKTELAGQLCDGCGLVEWKVLAPALPNEHVTLTILRERCACEHELVRGVVEEHNAGEGETARPIAVPPRWWRYLERGEGCLEVAFCRGCESVEWYARGFRKLKKKKNVGLRRLVVEKDDPKGGPYR